jgi:hypothetical protein
MDVDNSYSFASNVEWFNRGSDQVKLSKKYLSTFSRYWLDSNNGANYLLQRNPGNSHFPLVFSPG